MTELKLQLAEVLVALAKAVYDLSAVGAALTPHNLENLQMCRDLLYGTCLGHPYPSSSRNTSSFPSTPTNSSLCFFCHDVLGLQRRVWASPRCPPPGP